MATSADANTVTGTRSAFRSTGGDRHARVRAAAAEAFLRHELHQRSLNEVLGPNPTAEQLAAGLGAHFVGELQIPGVVRVLVAETPATLAVWRPAETRP